MLTTPGARRSNHTLTLPITHPSNPLDPQI